MTTVNRMMSRWMILNVFWGCFFFLNSLRKTNLLKKEIRRMKNWNKFVFWTKNRMEYHITQHLDQHFRLRACFRYQTDSARQREGKKNTRKNITNRLLCWCTLLLVHYFNNSYRLLQANNNKWKQRKIKGKKKQKVKRDEKIIVTLKRHRQEWTGQRRNIMSEQIIITERRLSNFFSPLSVSVFLFYERKEKGWFWQMNWNNRVVASYSFCSSFIDTALWEYKE